MRSGLPAQHTVRLERGGAIGGYVRDERGQPLAGVKVLPWGSGAAAYHYDPGNSRERQCPWSDHKIHLLVSGLEK